MMETSGQLPSIVHQWCIKEEKEKETLYVSSCCFCVPKTTEEKNAKIDNQTYLQPGKGSGNFTTTNQKENLMLEKSVGRKK